MHYGVIVFRERCKTIFGTPCMCVLKMCNHPWDEFINTPLKGSHEAECVGMFFPNVLLHVHSEYVRICNCVTYPCSAESFSFQ